MYTQCFWIILNCLKKSSVSNRCLLHMMRKNWLLESSVPAHSLLTRLEITAASTGSSAKVKEHCARCCTGRVTNSLLAYMEKKQQLMNLVISIFLCIPKQFKGLRSWAGKELVTSCWALSPLGLFARFLHSKCSKSKPWYSFSGACCCQPQRGTLPGKKGSVLEKHSLDAYQPFTAKPLSETGSVALPPTHFQRLCWNHLGNNAWGSLAENKQIL